MRGREDGSGSGSGSTLRREVDIWGRPILSPCFDGGPLRLLGSLLLTGVL